MSKEQQAKLAGARSSPPMSKAQADKLAAVKAAQSAPAKPAPAKPTPAKPAPAPAARTPAPAPAAVAPRAAPAEKNTTQQPRVGSVIDTSVPGVVPNTNFKGDDFVKFEVGTGVAQITFTRPQENNCLSAGLTAGLTAAVETLHARPDIRIVFMTAEGRNFCAGGDPKGFQAAAKMTDEDNLASAVSFAKFLYLIQTVPQFLVGLVQGSCYGGGVGIVAVCDMVIAVSSARFTLSEVKLGVIPATISPYVVAKLGVANSKRLFCTAEAPSAAQAKEYGLVQEVVANVSEFDTWKRKLIDQIKMCAPNAVAASKALVMGVANQAVTEELMVYTANELAKVRSGPEAEAGMAALLAKKDPYWKSQPMVAP